MAALISALQRSGAPHILQTTKHCLPHPSPNLSLVQFPPVTIARLLHSYTPTLTYTALPVLTGRAPAVLFLLHLLSVPTNSLTKVTVASGGALAPRFEVSCPGDTWRALEISLPCEGQADRGRPTTGYREFEERMGLRKGRYERDRENADIACWC